MPDAARGKHGIRLRARPPRPCVLRARPSGLALGLGILIGSAMDALLGDPRRGHPVGAFGHTAAAVERRIWADSRTRGVVFTALCAGSVLVLGIELQQKASGSRAGLTAATALAIWTVLGGTSLAEEAAAMARLIEAGNLPAARRHLPALCGRDPDDLDAAALARATVESLAENTSDAVVAPLFWGAVGGVPGLLGYRAINTLDAMVGHRSPRYARFGWAAARLDDLANLAPARLTALLAVTLAPAAGGSASRSLRILRRDGADHPSPNAGRCEAAFAGALGVQLGGMSSYQGQAERRGLLGDGPAPTASDIRRAILLSRLTGAAATVLAAAAACWTRTVQR
jgi:adenosylcobinamide-phosphate synthase